MLWAEFTAVHLGRGFQHHGAKGNVEADAFRKYFPSVLLFGDFGNEDIGCDQVSPGTLSCTSVVRSGCRSVSQLYHGNGTLHLDRLSRAIFQVPVSR